MPTKRKPAKAPSFTYSIVNPADYMHQTIHVPGSVFGDDFADTPAKKKQLFPVLVVAWDPDGRCPDHNRTAPRGSPDGIP